MERSREISIKGIGNLTAKPDYVIINLGLEKIDPNYSEGYKFFADHMKKLQKLVEEIGFSKDELKASAISSSQYQEYVKNKYVPMGYRFSASLSLSFDFDPERLWKNFQSLKLIQISIFILQ